MAIVQQTMNDEQRKSVALEYLKRIDRRENVLDLFADDTQFYYPKWGVANGKAELEKFFSDLTIKPRAPHRHDYAYFNYIIQGDLVVVEGTLSDLTPDGKEGHTGATYDGRFCDIFDIRDFKIQRLFVYLDPDYAGADTARYPWLNRDLPS